MPGISTRLFYFLDTYTRSLELEHACSIFLDTYTRSPEIEHACSNFLGTYVRYSEIKNASVKFYARALVRFTHVLIYIRTFLSIFSCYTTVLRSYKRMKWSVFIF